MAVCSSCGTRNARENTVCRSCGAVLGLEATPAAPSRDRWEVGYGEDAATLDDRADSAVSAAMASGDQAVPLARAALFGVVAAAILGVLWYLQMQNWPDIPPFAPFLIGWLTAVAIKLGAGQKSSPQLRLMAVVLTVLTFVIVLVIHLTAGDLAQFPQALQSWVEQDFTALLFLILGLFYAYRTLTPRPQARSPEGAEPEEKPADLEGEAETGEEDEAGEEPAEEDSRLSCARCQERIDPGEALIVPGAMRRSTVAVCPKCVAEIEERFHAETEDIQVAPAVLFGLGAAGVFGVAWYLLGRTTDSPLLNILALAAGWVIPEVVRYGAGKKRGRPLQLISLALTAALIVGVNVALAWGHEGGLVAGLSARVSDFLTVVIFLLALWQAYSGPAPRKLVGMRQQPEEEEEEEESAE